MTYFNNTERLYKVFKEYNHNLTRKQFNDVIKVWNAYINGNFKHIDDCYKNPSYSKESVYYNLNTMAWNKYDYCLDSGIISYNTCTFTWGAIVANKVEAGYCEYFAIYATAWRTEVIPIGIIDDIR